MRKETRVGSSHTHQWPHEAFAQIDPVMSTPTAKTSERWIATYDRMSHVLSPERRYAIAIAPAATNPSSATIASGTWM